MKKDNFLDVCKKCNALCCKLGGTNLTKEEVDKILNAGFENHFFEIVPGIYELKSHDNGVCPYLDKDNSCKIQDVKPLICTCWPIFPEFENNKVKLVLVNCPLAKHHSKEDLEKCNKEGLLVPQEVARITADESLIPSEQLKIINEICEKIESE